MSRSKEDLKRAFTAELHAMLARWKATISAEDRSPEYHEGSDIEIVVTFSAIWDSRDQMVREYTEVHLGQCVEPPEEVRSCRR